MQICEIDKHSPTDRDLERKDATLFLYRQW